MKPQILRHGNIEVIINKIRDFYMGEVYVDGKRVYKICDDRSLNKLRKSLKECVENILKLRKKKEDS